MYLFRPLGLLAALVGIYWIGLDGPFLFDDYFNLQPVRDWFNGQRNAPEVILGNSSGVLGRPMSMVSFLLSAGLGAHAPLFYKLGNLALHFCIALLVVNITQRLIKFAKLPLPGYWAWLAGALWAVHPLHVSTVLYSVQRMAQLSTLFMLLGVLCFLVGAAAMESGRAQRGWVWWSLGLPVCWLLGLFSKENALALPGLLWVVSTMLEGRHGRVAANRILLLTLWLPSVFGLALLAWRWSDLVARYGHLDFGPWERLLTEGRVLWQYLRLWFWPDIAVMGLYWDDTVVSRGLLSPLSTLIAALGLIALTWFAWWVRRRLPLFWLGWLWFLVGHAVESTVLPLDLMYEHRNYLPAIGLVWMVVGVFVHLASQVRCSSVIGSRSLRVFALAICVGLAWQTHALAFIWQDYDRLMLHGYSGHPQSPRARQAYATSLIRQAKYDEAREIVARGMADGNPRERFLARLDLLSIDCMAGTASSIDDDVLFSELPRYFGTGEIAGVNQMLRVASGGKCQALPLKRVATIIESMLQALPEGAVSRFGRRELLRAISGVYVSLGQGSAAMRAAEQAFSIKPDVSTAGLRLVAAVNVQDWKKAELALAEMRKLADESHSLLDQKELGAAVQYLSVQRAESSIP